MLAAVVVVAPALVVAAAVLVVKNQVAEWAMYRRTIYTMQTPSLLGSDMLVAERLLADTVVAVVEEGRIV